MYCEDQTPTVELRRVYVDGAVTNFVFWAIQDTAVWEIKFAVPHGVGTGQVYNDDDTDVYAVLIFNTEDIMGSGDVELEVVVEPSRAQWHTEMIDTIGFWNIERILGVENADNLLEVLVLPTGEEAPEDAILIPLEDGYNTELSFNEDTAELGIMAEVGLGKGASPDYGDTAQPVTVSGEPSSPEESSGLPEGDPITVINGIAPKDGDIPIEVSPLFGLKTEDGKIEIIVKS